MQDDKSISGFRSEVIERAINIEWIVNAIISQHYFGKVMRPFLLEFLYDEYCSFVLKRRVLEKIVPNLDRHRLQDLNRVFTIRNYFAHCNQVLIEGSDPTSPSAIPMVVDSRKLDKAVDFEKLHTEFMKIAGPLEDYLAKVYQAKDGFFLMKDDDFKNKE